VKQFGGRVLFLDRNDINTDEIIPAKYLNESSREALRPFLLEDLKLSGFDPRNDLKDRGAVLTRANFGCGSSREHAPWALEMNGINIVIAESFARIFRQNMYNCGLIAAELPATVIDGLFKDYAGKETVLTVVLTTVLTTVLTEDTQNAALTFKAEGKERTVPFTLHGFERSLVESGGWLTYAAARY
jgi:3-isopropylmalate/(R)-2-methylmalate dehydratase small subunit